MSYEKLIKYKQNYRKSSIFIYLNNSKRLIKENSMRSFFLSARINELFNLINKRSEWSKSDISELNELAHISHTGLDPHKSKAHNKKMSTTAENLIQTISNHPKDLLENLPNSSEKTVELIDEKISLLKSIVEKHKKLDAMCVRGEERDRLLVLMVQIRQLEDHFTNHPEFVTQRQHPDHKNKPG